MRATIRAMNKKMKLSVPKARKLTKTKSDYQLAQKLGVTRQCVSMWRKRGFIGYAYAEKLNQAWNMPDHRIEHQQGGTD